MPRAKKKAAEKILLLELKGNKKKKIIIPENWKVTFGPLVPGSKGGYNGHSGLALRIYESPTKQRAVFTDVVSFRDLSIPVEEEVLKIHQQKAYKDTPEGRKDFTVEAQVREWRNADDQHEPDEEFLSLPPADEYEEEGF